MARNPFRSEAEAYRFLLLTVGYFALIVVAASIATWLGVVVFVVLTAAALWLWLRSRPSEPALKPALPAHERLFGAARTRFSRSWNAFS